MDLSTLVTIFGLVGGGGVLGLLGKVAKMSMDYQKLKTQNETLCKDYTKLHSAYEALSVDYNQTKIKVEQNEKRDEEERKDNAAKFNELYNSRNKTNETLAELSTTIKLLVTNIDQQFAALDKKIDALRKD